MSATQEGTAIQILDGHRIMAISTVRPDGWPQTTVVGYANVGLLLFFLIFRSSQKFANIAKDNRVSVAVAPEPRNLGELQAVYAGGFASEVVDAEERELGWKLLVQRHPNMASLEAPSSSGAAMMRFQCKYVSVLDFAKTWGESETFTID